MQPLTHFSTYTPAEVFDLRCEYEVPRFIDLNSQDELAMYPPSENLEEEFFQWF